MKLTIRRGRFHLALAPRKLSVEELDFGRLSQFPSLAHSVCHREAMCGDQPRQGPAVFELA